MFNIKPTPSIQELLSKFTQEQIMEKIIGVPINSGVFCSPFRKDDNPSCSYYYNNKGEICFKDFGAYLHGNIYSMMGYKLGLLINGELQQSDIPEVKRGLWNLMEGQIPWTEDYVSSKDYSNVTINNGIIDWKWKTRDWDLQDKEYWGKYGVPFYVADNHKIFCPLLDEYEIIPVSHVWINGEEKKFLRSNKDNPTYIYRIKNLDNNGYAYKCYKPLDPTGKWKWRSTSATFNPIQGLKQVTSNDKVFICTSLKDSIVLHVLFPEYRGIAWPSESSIPNLNNLPFTIQGYFSDSDWPGMRIAVNIKREFNLPILHLPMSMKKELKIKDLSDLVAKWGIEKSKNYVTDRYEQLRVTEQQPF